MQPNNVISDIILSLLLLTVSTPPETGPAGEDKEVGETSRIDLYSTDLRKLQKPLLSQSFLSWTVEDRPRQEDPQ